MITRRRFIPLVSSAAFASSHAPLFSQATGEPLKFKGDFDFRWVDGGLKMRANDVVVGGVKLPSGTWGWIGVAVGQALLNGLGSLII